MARDWRSDSSRRQRNWDLGFEYQRHCEPTGRANARPMTGSAKQSISPRKGRMDCFRLRSLSYGGQVVATLLGMTWTVRLHISMSSPANAGDPVRRALSIPSSASLEYWMTRLRG